LWNVVLLNSFSAKQCNVISYTRGSFDGPYITRLLSRDNGFGGGRVKNVKRLLVDIWVGMVAREVGSAGYFGDINYGNHHFGVGNAVVSF